MRRLIISILALLSVATLSAQGGDERFRLQVQADLGTIFLDGAGGPTVTLGVGVRMFDHLYVGAETGFDTMIKRTVFPPLPFFSMLTRSFCCSFGSVSSSSSL